MNLRNLAPGIQEQLLFLSADDAPKIREAVLRGIAKEMDWSVQMEMFKGLLV
jgi:hypothetical protein